MPILVVDDSISSLSLITRMVERLCPEVHSFSDPSEALDFASTHTLAMAITDFDMPGIDGISLTLRLRQIPMHADLPVVMLTANTDSAIRYRALDAGMSDFLRKPFDEVELSVRLRNLLALRKSQQDAQAYTTRLESAVRVVSERLSKREEEIILRLSRAAEYRDTDTGSHIVRMAAYCRIIAQHAGLDAAMVQMIYRAAPLHDIGKMAISDNILHKPGPLSPDERRIMETHTVQGHAILKDSDCELLKLGGEIALNHHERWDGKGYPNGLAGEAIPLAARIASVADVYDALTTSRPYKRAWSQNEARDFIAREAGRQFDPQCVAALLSGWCEILDIQDRSRAEEDLARGMAAAVA